MTRPFIASLALTIATALALVQASPARGAGPSLQELDRDGAWAEVSSSQGVVFVDLYADW